jgi:hypothetical protein
MFAEGYLPWQNRFHAKLQRKQRLQNFSRRIIFPQIPQMLAEGIFLQNPQISQEGFSHSIGRCLQKENCTRPEGCKVAEKNPAAIMSAGYDIIVFFLNHYSSIHLHMGF